MAISYRLVRETQSRDYELVEGQRQIAEHREGGLIVLGGTRTGKTVALIEAGISGLREQIPQVLFLVGSRRTRMNLQARVGSAWPELSSRFIVDTVHRWCLSVMKTFGPAAEDLDLLSVGEQEGLISWVVRSQDLADWPGEFREIVSTRGFLTVLRETLLECQNMGFTPGSIADLAHEQDNPRLLSFARFFEKYHDALVAQGKLDYGELVNRTIELLHDEQIRAQVCPPGLMVMVDDYEDFDFPPEILRCFTTGHHPMIVATNPDVQVNGFRGARLRGVADLVSMMKDSGLPTKVVALHQGFTQVREVVQACQPIRDLIAVPPLGAPALTTYRLNGAQLSGKVSKYLLRDAGAQGEFIAGLIREAHSVNHVRYDDMVVIARTKNEVHRLARSCELVGVPVRVSDEEMQLNTEGSVLELLGALSIAARLGEPSDRRLEVHSSSLRLGATRLGEGSPDTSDIEQLLWTLWSTSEEKEHFEKASQLADSASLKAHRILDSVLALFSWASMYAHLPVEIAVESLIDAVMSADVPENLPRPFSGNIPAVRITTPHRAKGRSWPFVVVASLLDGMWPSRTHSGDILGIRSAVGGSLSELQRLDSERKLFYAACCASTKELILTSINSEHHRPSVFFDQVLAPVRHLSSMPETLGTPGELIGVLRNVLVDSGAHPGLRHMAARRLAEMSHHDVFHGADPAQWWKGVSLVSGEPPQQAPVVVSASSLETLFECPRRWYVTQRLGARRPVVSLTMGSLIHDLLQETSWTHQQRLDALHDRWGELDHLAPWQDAHHREAAQRILERYDLWAARNSRTVLATEVSVELVQESSPLVVKGRIDRVDVDEAGQLWVIDYKTGSTFSRYTAKKAASNIQLGVYQLALEAGGIPGLVQPGHTRGGAELIGLGCDESSSSSMPKILGQAPLSTTPHLSEEISPGVLKAGLVDVGDQYQHRTWVDHRLTIVQSIISSGQYHALGGHHCLFCPVKNGCPTTLGGGLP